MQAAGSRCDTTIREIWHASRRRRKRKRASSQIARVITRRTRAAGIASWRCAITAWRSDKRPELTN